MRGGPWKRAWSAVEERRFSAAYASEPELGLQPPLMPADSARAVCEVNLPARRTKGASPPAAKATAGTGSKDARSRSCPHPRPVWKPAPSRAATRGRCLSTDELQECVRPPRLAADTDRSSQRPCRPESVRREE